MLTVEAATLLKKWWRRREILEVNIFPSRTWILTVRKQAKQIIDNIE
jgi:hypothetical protein